MKGYRDGDGGMGGEWMNGGEMGVDEGWRERLWGD